MPIFFIKIILFPIVPNLLRFQLILLRSLQIKLDFALLYIFMKEIAVMLAEVRFLCESRGFNCGLREFRF
jgi:hypothetical protein